MLGITVLPLSTMFTCKETHAVIIALHKKGSIVVKKASGRPRMSSKRQNRLLKLIQLPDRGTTSTELVQEWHQAGVSASARTVRQRLLEDGLVLRKAAKKPLSRNNIRDRLISYIRYSDWSAEDWGKVIFSDESPFPLFGGSGNKACLEKTR